MSSAGTAATLQGLIETCKDSEYEFRACAEHVESDDLRHLFAGRAEDYRQAAQALQAQAVPWGGQADADGSAGGALHRGWVALRGTLTGYTDAALLDECAHGEETAAVRYQMALEQPLPEAAKEIVERLAKNAWLSRDQIRDLADRLRGEA